MNRHETAELAVFKLRARRRRLLRDLPELDEAEQFEYEASGGDVIDRAEKLETERLLHRMAETERRELTEVEAALRRFRDGRFGLCESCGRRVSARRLEVLPEARTCVRCAASPRSTPARSAATAALKR